MSTLTPQQIQELVHQLLSGSISPADQQLLEDWYNSGSEEELEWPEAVSRELLRAQLFGQVQGRMEAAPVRKMKVSKNNWWAAAAAVLLIAGAGGYWLLRDQGQPSSTAQVFPGSVHDIKAPVANKAIISSSDGKQIEFDAAQQGALAIAGAVKTGSSSLKFEAGPGTVSMRTVSNPKGSRSISIELPDGTMAWLNAASTLQFPSAFNANERVVTMTGEAYFEVKHGAQPFKVKAGSETIEDIGTSFNVRAYVDEQVVKTTLVTGAVKTRERILKAGEQAIASGEKFQLLAEVNLEDVTAWKDNQFKYHSVDVNSILSDAARWYNVEIEYRGKIEGTVTGGIERSVNASEFLKILEATGRMRFEISDKKITVIPMRNQP